MAMDQRWNNARHCAAALKDLLEHLRNQHDGSSRQQIAEPGIPGTIRTASARRKYLGDSPKGQEMNSDLVGLPNKRVRHTGDEFQPTSFRSPSSRQQDNPQNPSGDFGDGPKSRSTRTSSLDAAGMFPFSEESGANFEYGNAQDSFPDGNDLIGFSMTGDMDGTINGGFGNIGWESMANNWGPTHDGNSWGLPNL